MYNIIIMMKIISGMVMPWQQVESKNLLFPRIVHFVHFVGTLTPHLASKSHSGALAREDRARERNNNSKLN